MRAAATVAAWLSVLPAAAQSGHHLRWMSFFDPPPLDSLNSWINLLHTEHVAELAQTFASTGVPSLLTLTVDGSNTGGGGGIEWRRQQCKWRGGQPKEHRRQKGRGAERSGGILRTRPHGTALVDQQGVVPCDVQCARELGEKCFGPPDGQLHHQCR